MLISFNLEMVMGVWQIQLIYQICWMCKHRRKKAWERLNGQQIICFHRCSFSGKQTFSLWYDIKKWILFASEACTILCCLQSILFHTCLSPFVPTEEKMRPRAWSQSLENETEICAMCMCGVQTWKRCTVIDVIIANRSSSRRKSFCYQFYFYLYTHWYRMHGYETKCKERNEVKRMHFPREFSSVDWGNWTNKKQSKKIFFLVAWKMETKFRNRSACMARMSVCAALFTSFTVQWVFGVAFINGMNYYKNSFAFSALRLHQFDSFNPTTVAQLKIYLPLKNFTATIYAIYILS